MDNLIIFQSDLILQLLLVLVGGENMIRILLSQVVEDLALLVLTYLLLVVVVGLIIEEEVEDLVADHTITKEEMLINLEVVVVLNRMADMVERGVGVVVGQHKAVVEEHTAVEEEGE